MGAQHIFLCESISPSSIFPNQSPFNSKAFPDFFLAGAIYSKGSFKRDVTQESEISLLLASTAICEESNPEFPLHCNEN